MKQNTQIQLFFFSKTQDEAFFRYRKDLSLDFELCLKQVKQNIIKTLKLDRFLVVVINSASNFKVGGVGVKEVDGKMVIILTFIT